MRNYKENNKTYYHRHRERILESRKLYYEENKELIKPKMVIASKNWAQNNPEKRRLQSFKSHIRKKYGISLDEYNNLLVDAENRCESCGRESPLVIDHNHETGQIRGILCWNCNVAAGHCGDDAELLYCLADYMKERNRCA